MEILTVHIHIYILIFITPSSGELSFRVKLVVTEITHTDSHKTLRKILSPIAANIPIVPKSRFGMFHTALIIGPWYLEWNGTLRCNSCHYYNVVMMTQE